MIIRHVPGKHDRRTRTSNHIFLWLSTKINKPDFFLGEFIYIQESIFYDVVKFLQLQAYLCYAGTT